MLREEEIIDEKIQETPERLRILKRIKEAEKAYIKGDVKRTTNFEEFWKDINDYRDRLAVHNIA